MSAPFSQTITPRDKKLLVVALVLAAFLGAIEGTIVTLAIPTIVRDLAGFDLISLLFSVFLLTSALSTPVYGKVADQFGRKRALDIGIVVFLVGSVACALAQSMEMLIAARALQGIGAGALFAIPIIIVGDVFELKQRSKVQGLLSGVWGVASLVGPFAGGLIISMASWHWIFLINIPFGLLAMAMLKVAFHEERSKRTVYFDLRGVALLTIAMTAFLSIFIFTGEEGVAPVPVTIACLVATAAFLVVFYHVERRARDPIVHFDLFTRSNILVNAMSFLATAALMGVDVYMPIYLQNVRGMDPTLAGLCILPNPLAWSATAFVLGRVILRFGSRAVNLAGSVLTLLSLVLLIPFSQTAPLPYLLAVIGLQGVGFGMMITTQTIIIQDSVGFEKRGGAVAVNTLLRTIGQTIGISIFGTLFNLSIIRGFLSGGITTFDLGNLYDMSVYGPEVTWDHIVEVLDGSMHVIFIAFMVIIAVSLLLALFMPRFTPTDNKGSAD
ncbi:MAG: MFS transporter [Coriobacteriales bacterium]|jgi:EmrB/QacA subfamily drug resistance transporter|nr:MFS transporter [Coriobacteriales bacterium]